MTGEERGGEERREEERKGKEKMEGMDGTNDINMTLSYKLDNVRLTSTGGGHKSVNAGLPTVTALGMSTGDFPRALMHDANHGLNFNAKRTLLLCDNE